MATTDPCVGAEGDFQLYACQTADHCSVCGVPANGTAIVRVSINRLAEHLGEWERMKVELADKINRREWAFYCPECLKGWLVARALMEERA